MPETRYKAVTGGCSNCSDARYPSLIGEPKTWGLTSFPYCLLLAKKGTYSEAKITCLTGEFDKKCPLIKEDKLNGTTTAATAATRD